MTDVHDSATRSFNMSRIKSKDTEPEIRLRQALWARGLRYRVTNTLIGRPDIVFASSKTAVFVDGCFWHRCPKHFKTPTTNREFWSKKLSRNVDRDDEVTTRLQKEGWNVIRVWEHDVIENLVSVTEKIVSEVRNSKNLV